MTEDKKQKITIVNKKLRIILKSDLCVGSGFSCAGIIDSDVSYNKNGIPFISGRRLKGCLREAAELIGVSDIQKIFGERGKDGVNGIFIGNAFPENFDAMKEVLSELQQGKDEYAKYLSCQNILELYTSVKAQTKIGENGVAEDNTLRFLRTVNQFDKTGNTDMVFETELSYEYVEENDPIKDDLLRIIKATRNIGMNRNRGLGSVKLEFFDKKPDENGNETSDKKTDVSVVEIDDQSKQNGKKRICYCITNIQPLLMSSSQDSVTENYISGTSVLGAFAREYLKDGSEDCKEFREMFLEGKIIFSNLTLAEKEKNGEKWEAAYPAPLYINRLKRTKKLVNVAAEIPSQNINEKNSAEGFEREYSTENGNQPKKLKGQFILYRDGKYNVKEVQKEIIYHHTKKGKSKQGKDGLLYFLEAIEENQHFYGEIIVENDDHLEKIKELLKRIKMRFGKSKSAQYGLCRVEPYSVIVKDYEPIKAVGLCKGMKVLVTLLSDGIFVNEKGVYTIQHDEVRELIGRQLKLSVAAEDTKSCIQTKVLTGFYTKWNLKKQELPVIQAGSAFEYTLQEDLPEYEEYIGERNIEGFGKCRIVPLTGAKYCLEEMEKTEKTADKKKDLINTNKQKNYLNNLFREILLDKLAVHMKEKAFESDEIKISPSALGRLSLMLTEVENETDSSIDKYILLRKRINSIKSKDTQTEIMRSLENILGKDVFTNQEEKESWEDNEKRRRQQKNIVDKIKEKKDKTGNIEEYDLLLRYFGEDMANFQVFQLWSGYLKNILVYQKYLKK